MQINGPAAQEEQDLGMFVFHLTATYVLTRIQTSGVLIMQLVIIYVIRKTTYHFDFFCMKSI